MGEGRGGTLIITCGGGTEGGGGGEDLTRVSIATMTMIKIP